MNAIDNIFHNIPTISADTNFWMIRTKQGFFFNEFLSNEYVAIGWNLITHAKIKGGLTRAQADRLKAQIKETYGEAVPGAALNKCTRFCDDIKTGDIAMIVDALPFLLCYIAIFGGRVGDYEFNSVITFIKGLLNRQYEKEKQDLELRKLKAETKIAEQDAISKELDNLQHTYELQAKLVDECVEPLTIAADRLQIQPADSTRAVITNLLETQINAQMEG